MEKPNESPKRRSSRKDSLERFELWRQICWLQLIWIVQIDEIGLFFCSETCANLHITTQVESFANMQVQGGMSSMSMSWMCTINLWHIRIGTWSQSIHQSADPDSKSTKIGPGRPQKPPRTTKGLGWSSRAQDFLEGHQLDVQPMVTWVVCVGG